MLHFQIDLQSGVPVYRQLMEQIRHYVASGTLKADGQLPSIREMAKSLAVNPTTVVKAYSELEHEGVIEMRQGRGAFVSRTAPECPPERKKERLSALASQLVVEAKQMGAEEGDVISAVKEALGEIYPRKNKNHE